ncbi:MAG: tRNA (guanosine(46)-N7)-methyltransferase TrmB [Alkaliphilus sp.]|nr:tRNA (guanosine(46)-N7)-methyltransferase TrmB [Alkaliphilus sp.]
MRRRKKPGSMEKLLSYSNYVYERPEILKGNWNDYFENSNPIHVELGTGRGQFITRLAVDNPEINYVGIEIKEEILLKAVEKAIEKDLRNIIFLCIDINRIEEIFAKEEISRIYINFCDPWPKKRCAKRRLTHRGFLDKYINLLIPKGEIYFKTDNEKLFEFSLNELALKYFLLRNITFDLHSSEYQQNVTTEYEDKFSSLNMKIYRCEAAKTIDNSANL